MNHARGAWRNNLHRNEMCQWLYNYIPNTKYHLLIIRLKKKETNRQIIEPMTQHIELKNNQHGPHQKLGVISSAP